MTSHLEITIHYLMDAPAEMMKWLIDSEGGLRATCEDELLEVYLAHRDIEVKTVYDDAVELHVGKQWYIYDYPSWWQSFVDQIPSHWQGKRILDRDMLLHGLIYAWERM